MSSMHRNPNINIFILGSPGVQPRAYNARQALGSELKCPYFVYPDQSRVPVREAPLSLVETLVKGSGVPVGQA